MRWAPQAEETQRFLFALRGRRRPVETFDERFTTTLANSGPSSQAPEDARAAAHLLESYLAYARPGGPARDRGSPARRLRARRVRGPRCLARRRRDRRGLRGRGTAPNGARVVPPKPLRVVFPEGFTRKEMVQRVVAVARDRAAEAEDHAEALRRRVRGATKAAKPPRRASEGCEGDRGLPLPRDLRVHAEDDAGSSSSPTSSSSSTRSGPGSISRTRRRRTSPRTTC